MVFNMKHSEKQIAEQLSALCTSIGVAGHETAAANAAAEMLRAYTDEVKVDEFGNVTALVRCVNDHAPTILLDAHIDEIGMIVTGICDKGFLRVSNCGGIDRRLLAAQDVTVHTADGELFGVVGSKPPHLEKPDDAKKVPEMDEVFIDIGFDKEAAEQRVALGDRVTINSSFRELLGGHVTCKALDDRAGVAAILYALELIKGRALNRNIAVLFSAQEEVGSMGAKIAAFSIAPDEAIAVDVSFGLTADAKPIQCGKMNGGAMVGVGAMLNRTVSDTLIELAKSNEIPHQVEVLTGRSTGTNADSIMLSKGGVITGLLSIPLRYMHTPVELVKLSDIKATASLLAEYVLRETEEVR